METTFLCYTAIVIGVIFLDKGLGQGSQSMKNGATSLNTGDGEIAHLTCTSRDLPVPSIRWEKGGNKLQDQSPGAVIISWTNGTIGESHLLVAVTSDERRGTYTCVMLNKDGETRKTFVIEGQKRAKLKRIDQIAIGVGIGVSFSLLAILLLYLIRGIKRRKEVNLRDKQIVATQVNSAIEDDTSF